MPFFTIKCMPDLQKALYHCTIEKMWDTTDEQKASKETSNAEFFDSVLADRKSAVAGRIAIFLDDDNLSKEEVNSLFTSLKDKSFDVTVDPKYGYPNISPQSSRKIEITVSDMFYDMSKKNRPS